MLGSGDALGLAEGLAPVVVFIPVPVVVPALASVVFVSVVEVVPVPVHAGSKRTRISIQREGKGRRVGESRSSFVKAAFRLFGFVTGETQGTGTKYGSIQQTSETSSRATGTGAFNADEKPSGSR